MKKSRFKEIVKEVLVEDNEYQVFFQKALEKAGKSIPQMGDQEKRDFFNKIDAAWKGKGEKKLVGNQSKLDVDKDGEIEASDLKKLRSEAISSTKVDAKSIASKMRNSKTMKGFADKVEKMGKVSHKDVENLLPDYVAGKDIAGLFESKQSLNEGWFDIISQGALVLALIAWAFQLKGYSFNPSGFKKLFTDIKKWWRQLKMDKDLVRIVTKMTQDKEIMAAAKEKVVGPRGGKRPQWESDDKFREFLKQKLGSADYNTLKKFTQVSRYRKDPNSGAWLNQNTYTSKYSKDMKNITGESVNEASYGKFPEGIDIKQTLQVALKIAKAISIVDGTKVTVNKKTLEPGSFDLDVDGIEYDGGSYNLYDTGVVANMATRAQPVFGNWKKDNVSTYVKNLKKLKNESINEDEKKVWKYKGVLLVDSDFVNFCKGKLPNSELKHAGGGDFFLQTPDGMISFDRTNGSLEGMSGRAHQVSDNQGGKLLALLIKKMGAKIVTESINEAKNYYTISGDRYDGGVDLIIYVNDKKVYDDWSAGDHDWTYKKKDYNHINKLLDKVAKDNGLKSHKDFKRV